MSSKIVIVGSDQMLGAYLALENLASSQDAAVAFVACGADQRSLEEWRGWVGQRAAAGEEATLGSRLQVFTWDCFDSGAGVPDYGSATEAWLLCAGLSTTQCNAALSALHRHGVLKCNYVSLWEQSHVERFCQTHGIEWRWFRVSIVVGEGPKRPFAAVDPWSQFLDAVYELKSEIAERSKEYFNSRSLRCWMPAGAKVNLIPAGTAAELMLRIARQDETKGVRWDIASSQDMKFEEVCEQVSAAYDLKLVPEQDRERLNSIDRILDRRLRGLQAYFDGAEHWDWARSHAAAGTSPDLTGWETALSESLRESRTGQEAARKARDTRVDQLSKQMERKTLRHEGRELTYLVAGTQGPVLVILNALGQGLYYWFRLLERLRERHRLLIWEMPGISHPPYGLGVKNHVDDLDAVLRQEEIESCHLVGWCNGSKIAIEFYLRRPEAVSSMVFLNSTFRCLSGAQTFEKLDTEYARNFGSVCRMLDKNPALANSVIACSTADLERRRPLEDMDNDALARHVLSLVPDSLKSCVVAPFHDPSSTLNYARQILDFLAHDSNSSLPRVSVPALLIASELDQIASPEMSRAAARILPRSWYLQVAGASHYCLFDRPELVGHLIERFLRNPDSISSIGSTLAEVDFGDPEAFAAKVSQMKWPTYGSKQ